jgi:hypothetical protein
MSLMSQISQGFLRTGRKLSKLGRSMNEPYCPGKITINEKVITDLVPLGGYRQLGITKAGRLSFSGVFEGKRVKVYSTYSADQAKLRASIESTDLGRQFFPRVIVSDKTYIVEEWVDGLPLKKIDRSEFERATEEIERFLSECRNSKELIQMAAHHIGAFCYFQDYLIKRLEPWCVLDFVREFILSWQEAYERMKDNIEVRLSHPDLSAKNILLENKTRRVVVIDNELLGVGHGWILDRKNSIFNDSCQIKLERIHSDPKIAVDFLNKSWRLRYIGSALDAGDFQRAYTIATNPDKI